MTLLIVLISYVLTSWLVLFVHEYGHAVAGDLAGLRIFEIKVGSGPRIFRFRLSGINIEINLLPLAGIVRAFPPITGRRYQMIIFTAGGPAASILFLIAFIVISDRIEPSELTNAILVPALLSQLVIIFLCLWPREVQIYGRRMASDGLSFLRLLTSKEPYGAAYRAGYLATIMPYASSGSIPPTLTAQSDRLAFHLASRSQSDGILSDATILGLDQALSSGDTHPAEEMMVLDALITDLLCRDFSRYRNEMDRWSKRALELNPTSATLRGSRGSVLAELGRHDEALAMLADAENGQDVNDCIVNAYRALIHFRQGSKDRASDLFKVALSRYKATEWKEWPVSRIISSIGMEIGEVVPPGKAVSEQVAA
ncbi:site-2 protease family protein [Rhizobium sp. LjRoot254]|uniref:site-2 protease family protein n=1 Tax=Rhizobium sp. LjRoot254 TaxID=3342297 RepID=UPI003ECDAF1F